jgi:NAD+ diphosphatase
MLGFTADYDSGEITYNDQEIATADWFPTDNLPQIPPPGSISRVLIDDFVGAYQK